MLTGCLSLQLQVKGLEDCDEDHQAIKVFFLKKNKKTLSL